MELVRVFDWWDIPYEIGHPFSVDTKAGNGSYHKFYLYQDEDKWKDYYVELCNWLMVNGLKRTKEEYDDPNFYVLIYVDW